MLGWVPNAAAAAWNVQSGFTATSTRTIGMTAGPTPLTPVSVAMPAEIPSPVLWSALDGSCVRSGSTSGSLEAVCLWVCMSSSRNVDRSTSMARIASFSGAFGVFASKLTRVTWGSRADDSNTQTSTSGGLPCSATDITASTRSRCRSCSTQARAWASSQFVSRSTSCTAKPTAKSSP